MTRSRIGRDFRLLLFFHLFLKTFIGFHGATDDHMDGLWAVDWTWLVGRGW